MTMPDVSTKAENAVEQPDCEVSSLAECLDGADLDSVRAEVEAGPDFERPAGPIRLEPARATAARFQAAARDRSGGAFRKICFTILSCLVLSVIFLGVLYSLDYLDMDDAEKIIYTWHLGAAAP